MTLSIEQSFNLTVFKQQVALMSREQAQALLIEAYEILIEKDNAYKQLIAHKWGIDIKND
jgi:hypothetical protein